MTTSNSAQIFMDSQTISLSSSSSSIQQHQTRRLMDFLQDQDLPFPRPRKSAISLFIRAFKSSSMLPRTISRRFFTKSESCSCPPEPTLSRTTSVTVKDILRWRSFRDRVDPMVNINVPLTLESPSRCTNTTSSTNSGSPRSSWNDSDFSVGDSPIWCRGFTSDHIEVDCKKTFHVNIAGDTKDTKGGIELEEEEVEEEQFSPISVLDFGHDREETFSSFNKSLANMKSRNMMLKQRIQDFETLIENENCCYVNKNTELDDVESFEIEEKAIQLMDQVKTTSSEGVEWDPNMEILLLDFFRDELIMTKGVIKSGCQVESRLLKMARSWMKGVDDGSLEWELEGTNDVCIGEMLKRGNWKGFESEEQEIGLELEKIMLNHLLDELIMDLVIV
ncbi:uncharacterized protein [Rutidosis leptorrhynchoides]|uniref:uncharacterized protein n=1 Tax=Rutidosis leptorrhynchoides TaxID=125765 RepID=UPI003A990BC0